MTLFCPYRRLKWRGPRLGTLTVTLALLALSGCTTIAPGFRAEHAREFQASLDARTEEALPPGTVLGLDECLKLAMAHNLDLRAQRLAVDMARLDESIAFSAFLPQVTASASVTSWDRQPASQMLGPVTIPTHDKTLRDVSYDVQMPIAVPATWLLYSIRGHGASSAEYGLDYARQMIALNVTSAYYECLALMASRDALRTQLDHVRVFARELNELYGEGLVAAWQWEQAKTAAMARQTALQETERSLQQRKGSLLHLLGLSPLTDVSLQVDAPLEMPSEALPDLVYGALRNHPRLHVADRDVAIAEDEVKISIMAFLPNLAGFASFANTSESRSQYKWSSLGGFASFMTLFNGFANVHDYRNAKGKAEKAYIEREAQCIALMAEVQAAYLNTQTAGDYLAVADQALAAAEAHLKEVEARVAEGLLLGSDHLQVLAERDEAQSQRAAALFRHQLSIAVLLNTLGGTYAGS